MSTLMQAAPAGRSLSRREFLKKVGAGVAAAIAAHALFVQAEPALASEAIASNAPAMLIDLTRCVGCNSCALACKQTNELPNVDTVPTKLDSTAYTYVANYEVAQASGDTVSRHVKRQCMHCLEPACVAACPAAAMYKSEEGPVIYRAERCLGCRYCQIACPFGVPTFDWNNGLTPRIRKCWLCYDRLKEGSRPACVEACPTGALRFGRRDELLVQAHAQIATNPGRYIDHVFGEHEVGGTSVLYLSDIPFEDLGFPVDLPDEAPPEATEKVMGVLPAVITGVSALMIGTTIYTHRRSPHQAEQSQHAATPEQAAPPVQDKE